MTQHSVHTTTFRVASAVIMGAWLVATAAAQSTTPAAAAGQKTLADGVYTAAQADRGAALFKTTCESCHAAGDFANADFVKKYSGKALFEIFDVIHSTMPMDNPGTLKPQQSADLVAMILRSNKFPAGQEELTNAAPALKAIKFDKK